MFFTLCAGGGRLSFFVRPFGQMIVALMAVGMISIVSILVNQTSDLEFVKYLVSMALIVGAAYFVSRCVTATYPGHAGKYLMFNLIACVALQCLLAIVLFVSEPTKDFLMSLVNASDVEADLISSTGEFRLLGFGSTFFGAGITNGMALLLIVFCFRHYVGTRRQALVLGFAYMFIGLVGILMSRTTVLGMLLSLVYLHLSLYFGDRETNRGFYGRFMLSLLTSAIVGLVIVFSVVDFSIMEPVIDWAFEPVINYFSGEGLKSASTDQLMDMYGGVDLLELPWWIGDAMFYDPSEAGTYYMHVDVGYLRLIYYFGIPGLLVYFIFQFRAIAATFAFFRRDQMFVAAVLLYLVLLNFKGFADLFAFSILFFMCQSLVSGSRGKSFIPAGPGRSQYELGLSGVPE